MATQPSDDALDQAACYEIRKLLKAQGVPSAAFIDDHVANAIAQRNILTECIVSMHATLTPEQQQSADDALARAYPTGVDLRAQGEAAVRHLQKSQQQ